VFPRVFGRYVLERALSRGGMGDVYLAVARGFEKRCVIKTIRADFAEEEEFVGRFADEAKIMVRIDHPNIVRVFDAGKVRSEYYIAMEHLHGADLGDVLDRTYERGHRLSVPLGLHIATQLLAGLSHAHALTDEQGRPMRLVHRDVSPQNVLVGFDGRVKLIDFGLARSELLPSRTLGELPIGKYGYMSPEQARHDPIDGRADVYAAGVMLFEVFTGNRLVDEEDKETLWRRVLHPQHRLPSFDVPRLPAGIDELVSRAVAADPGDRFPSAEAMRDFVETLRRSHPADEAALARQMRRLYAKSERELAPVPSLEPFTDRVEASLIIATSTRRQRSVFGRGSLPIEGTMELDATSLRRAIRRARAIAEASRTSADRSSLDASTEADTLISFASSAPPSTPIGGAEPIDEETTLPDGPPPELGTDDAPTVPLGPSAATGESTTLDGLAGEALPSAASTVPSRRPSWMLLGALALGAGLALLLAWLG
jgi:serine/threonine protein kinase